jgi:hypothetical protein
VVLTLFGDAEGVVATKEMQATLAELPGLEGTTFYEDASRAAAARAGVRLGL